MIAPARPGARLHCGCNIRCKVTLGTDGRIDPNHPQAITFRLDYCPTHKYAPEVVAFLKRIAPELCEEERRRAELLLQDAAPH